MSRAVDAIYEALHPLRLYRLRQDSLIDKELAAYETAFSLAETLLDALEQQAFVQQASGDGLSRHEALVGLRPRSALGEQARRDLILYRLGSAPFDFNREGMLNSIRAAGMEAEIVEDRANERIILRCSQITDPSLDLDSLKQSVRTVLPAHLEHEFDIGDLTWDMFELSDPDWNVWDETEMTWGDFDLNGHNLFPAPE